MAKKSRTGKKKRPLYGPQGNYVPKQQVQLSEEEIQNIKRARRANYWAMGLLIVAMLCIFFAPNMTKNQTIYNLIMGGSYMLTIVAGGLILYTSGFVTNDRVKMTKITAYVMIGLGISGVLFTFMGWNPAR